LYPTGARSRRCAYIGKGTRAYGYFTTSSDLLRSTVAPSTYGWPCAGDPRRGWVRRVDTRKIREYLGRVDSEATWRDIDGPRPATRHAPHCFQVVLPSLLRPFFVRGATESPGWHL
jgi:hypothetical protein